jgi:hypothetical protein
MNPRKGKLENVGKEQLALDGIFHFLSEAYSI